MEKYVTVSIISSRVFVDCTEFKNIMYDIICDLKDIEAGERIMLRKVIDFVSSLDQTAKELKMTGTQIISLPAKQVNDMFSSKNRMQLQVLQEPEKFSTLPKETEETTTSDEIKKDPDPVVKKTKKQSK